MKNLITVLALSGAALLLCSCVGMEGSQSSSAGTSSYSWSKGLGIIAIEKYAEKHN